MAIEAPWPDDGAGACRVADDEQRSAVPRRDMPEVVGVVSGELEDTGADQPCRRACVVDEQVGDGSASPARWSGDARGG